MEKEMQGDLCRDY